ncbi:helix-turn-helix domain-containing protein [Vagococcus elongatus]|uniref:HTH cro/C1-type domain-containing protein n=1 Tax=Vagococcus elongatus TaxID=180344 RepID=A0A430AU26_9ENTE|nr:helix-turn-helix transcriptional regulator [Vagococcus elongatus]RSU11555.1 hypothetical protein CBF29_07690 [Vagococcus elongatus]
MFEISKDLSWQVRKKRALLRLTISEVASEMGISRQTLRKIESEELKKTTKTVFVKVTNWLLEEQEVI